MAALVTDPATTVTTFAPHKVEVIDYLLADGGWTVQPYLFCDELVEAANAYDHAKLHFDIGQAVLQPGASTLASYSPLSIRGKYVRITIPDAVNGDLVWVGYVPIEEVDRAGVVVDAGVNKFKGDAQLITAVGPEYFLDRNQVESAIVQDLTRIERALVFNGGPNHDLDPLAGPRGNRNAAANSDGLYSFTTNPTAGVLFTAGDIVKNLLKYHTPLDSVGAPAPLVYALHPTDAAAGMLEAFSPTIPTERETVFKLLNQICAPARGLQWWANTVDTGGGVYICYIRVATSTPSNITMPGGATFPANANQKSLDFDSEIDVKRCKVKDNGSRKYHKVIVRGERMTGTGTVGVQDGTLIADWTSGSVGMEAEYKAGASADVDYSGLDGGKKQARNDAMRKADRYLGVYSHFRIPADWNGKTGDGGTAGRDWLLAQVDFDGNVIGGLPLSAQGIRLLHKTRLKEGWDYTHPATPVSKTPDASLAPFAAPFAVMQVEKSPLLAGADGEPVRWQLVEHMDQPAYFIGTPIGKDVANSTPVKTTYDLHMLQTVPGVKLTANGGLNHACALSEWTGAEPSKQYPELDYSSLRCTVTMEADLYAEGVYFPTPPTNTPIEILVVDVGEHYRLDFIAKNTVVEVRNGELILAAEAGVLRDDRSTLRDLARIAYEWYAIDRKGLDVEFRQLQNIFALGMLITTVGAGTTQTTCNTMVSVLTYDLKAGTITLETADDTLDVRSLTGEKRRA